MEEISKIEKQFYMGLFQIIGSIIGEKLFKEIHMGDGQLCGENKNLTRLWNNT